MKKTLQLLSLVAVLFVSACNETTTSAANKQVPEVFNDYEKTTGGAQILFDTTVHDFGAVTTEEDLLHTFNFINSGDAPLIISKTKGSCGCTIPNAPKEPIEPGKTGQIEVVIDAANKPRNRQFNVSVQILSNAKDSVLRLGLKGVPVDEE